MPKPWEEFQTIKTPKPWEEFAAPQGIMGVDLPGVNAEPTDTQPLPTGNLTAGLINQAKQGATFGFGDEISAALLTAPQYLGRQIGRGINAAGEGLGYEMNQAAYRSPADIYNENLARERETLQYAQQEAPTATLAANLAGAIATGGLSAGSKGATAITNSLRSGSLPARVAKGALLGEATNDLYNFGAGEGGTNSRLGNVESNLGYGAAIGAAFPVAGAAIGGTLGAGKTAIKGFKARDVDALESSLEAIKNNSSQAYKVMRDNGAIFTPNTSNKIAQTLESTLKTDGKLNARLHGKVISLVDDFKAEAQAGDMGLESLDQWRQLFSDVAGDFGDKVNARKATLMIKAIDNSVDKLNAQNLVNGSQDAINALKLGRSEWSKARKFEAITDIVRKSDGDALYLKRELKKLLDNPKKTRGYSPEEMFALKKAAKLSTPEAIMKVIGKFGFDASRIGTGVGAAVGSGAAFGLGGGLSGAAIVPVVGTGARYGSKLAARAKVENLLQAIESGGKVSMKEIGKLPPAQAKETLSKLSPQMQSRVKAAQESLRKGK